MWMLMFAAVFGALQLARAQRQSATWDEPMHLTAGYVALTQGDFRVDPSHPPLARAWAAIPLALQGRPLDTTVIDRTPVGQWLSDGYAFARRFVSGSDIDWMLLTGRAMVVMWGIALGGFLFAWALEWKGESAAVLVLVLYAFAPNLVAHSALVTTDAALTTLVFGAVYFTWRVSRRASAVNVAGVATCTALACITKFSAVLLLPMLIVLLAVGIVRGTVRLRPAAVLSAVTALATLFAIWAAYGFRYAPSSNPDWLLTRAAFGEDVGLPWLASMIEWLDSHRLLPNAFAQGFIFSLSSARELPAFLAGKVQSGGWWYYFPIVLALKTPLTTLALCLTGIVVAMRPRNTVTGTLVFVLIPILVWLIAASVSGVNLGVRHVLPVDPFVILLAAIGAESLVRRRSARAIVVVALAMLVVEVGRSEPYPLSFFNALAGGPNNGFRYLADSNLAWGGSVKALKRWMNERQVSTINLAYFGSIDPATYGIRATYLPSSATFLAEQFTRPQLPGYVAISGTVLDGVYLPPWWRHFYAGFLDREPTAVVANTMRIYWVDRWPESSARALDSESLETLAEGLLFGLRWPEHALVHYEEYLRREPGNPAVWNGMALALAQTGRLAEALAVFHRVLALSPSDPDARSNITLLEQQIDRASTVRE
jgi:4-amino-4-deoxy-L-arabinose transferase-like glycosyltransferase